MTAVRPRLARPVPCGTDHGRPETVLVIPVLRTSVLASVRRSRMVWADFSVGPLRPSSRIRLGSHYYGQWEISSA